MSGKGVYRAKIPRLYPRGYGLGKSLWGCNRKRQRSNVVEIDVNCDDNDDPGILRGSGSNGKRKERNFSNANVICIDDDKEGYEETVGDGDSGMGWYFGESSIPVKLSKCKRTYSGNGSMSHQYGLGADTESVLNDDSDDVVEVEFEGSSGKIKQEWEKAFLRRQSKFFGSVDQAGTSRFFSDSHPYIGTGDKTEKGGGGLDFTNYTSHEDVDRSPLFPMDEGESENKFCDNGCEASTFVRVNGICIDLPFVTDQHTGEDMKNNEDGSLGAMGDVHGQSLEVTNNGCVLFNREMHKETDEYRCSVEAELAARQRELEIQAEEARHIKRMRKREKAEAMRLLDMERRQNLRVEEIRKTLKKDEENLYLKEQLRAEVREGLDTLEAACHDMTSILHGLGINVNGANGVHAALKRALLTFHPDRSSRADIRQQVEAEEKFKLVTRMKEKYLSTL